jgi:protein transport protein SEC24
VSTASTCAVSYGLVLAPSSFIDIGTLTELTNSSAGFLLHYPKSRTPSNPQALYSRIREDLVRELTKPFVYDAIVRLRCGPGLQEGSCFGSSGPILSSSQLDQNFPCLTCDSSFAFKIDYDGKLGEGDLAYFQLAVLHTTAVGERRIRLIYLCLPVASSPVQVFKYLDIEAILNYETKSMASRIITQPLNAISNNLLAKSSFLLAAYRRHCTTTVNAAQVFFSLSCF